MTPSGTGAYIFGCDGPNLTPTEADFFRAAMPWGFILFARNIEDPAQLLRLTQDLRDAVGWNAPILIDQEGGRVQRMRPPAWRQWFPPLDQMQRTAPEHAARAMRLRARLIAHELRSVGIDVNCTPTADVAQPVTHPFLRNRTFGDCPEVVIGASIAVAEGQLEGGVLPVVKHIPGHGRAVADSHLELPVVEASLDDLRAVDFAPFRALKDLPLAMSAHVVYTALDTENPGTTSPRVLSEVREYIGFRGLLMTDDISMGALPGDMASRTGSSLGAGCDLVLHCNGDMSEMEAVAQAAHALPVDTLSRSDAALSQRRHPETLDIAAVEADLETLLNGQVYDTAP